MSISVCTSAYESSCFSLPPVSLHSNIFSCALINFQLIFTFCTKNAGIFQ